MIQKGIKRDQSFNRFNSAGGIPGIQKIAFSVVTGGLFQSLQQRGGYSRLGCMVITVLGGYLFQSLQQRGGYSRALASMFGTSVSNDVSIASTARGVFQAGCGISFRLPARGVSIASTARGVFQGVCYGLYTSVCFVFQSLQQRGGYSR